MTGTAKEVEPELKRVYDLSVTRIPTHKPPRRQRLPDQVFRTSAERWEAVAHHAHAIAEQGRAVLVGTRSVEAIVSFDDPLFQRYVPRLTRMAVLILCRSKVAKRLLFRWLVVYAQSKAEARDRQSRFNTIKRDRKWLRALGFVGDHKK